MGVRLEEYEVMKTGRKVIHSRQVLAGKNLAVSAAYLFIAKLGFDREFPLWAGNTIKSVGALVNAEKARRALPFTPGFSAYGRMDFANDQTV